ncbi:MAG: ABC transporter substrate-binding protein [Chloroflexi bacterium]|nr:ABC transporter substrate-binding protein [Chloroflexota bacterium]
MSKRSTFRGTAMGLVALSLLAIVFLPGTVGAQQAQPKQGGTIILGITGDPPVIIGATNTNIPGLNISGNIYGTLLRMDNDRKLQPELAERWDIGSDGKTYTVYLRKGVKWHDGQPFTSKDVQYSIMEVNKKYNGQGAGAYALLDRIDTPDDYTAIFRLKSPSAAFFPFSLTDPTFAQIVAKHLYEGTDPTKNDANFKPVGTGPFRFAEWVKGDHVTLERNPDYYMPGQPYLDRVVFKVSPDNAARVLALEKGEIDFIPYYALPASAVKEIAGTPGLKAPNTVRPAAGEIILFYNLRNERLKIKEVRQAIAYGIDRKELLDKALDGSGNFAKSLIPSTQGDFHFDKGRQYDYNPERANALLDQAGMRRGADGTRFTVRLSFDKSQEAGALASAAAMMREQLAPVGVKLDIQPMDAAAWQETSGVKWDFDLTMGSYGTGPDPAVGTMRLYTTKNIQPQFGKNNMGYSNPVVDDLAAKGEVEMDHAKRLQIYNQIQEILNEDVPALPLWEKWYPIAYKEEFVGLPSGPIHWEPMDGVSWTKATGQAGGASATGGGGMLAVAGAVVVVLVLGGLLVVRRRRTRRA